MLSAQCQPFYSSLNMLSHSYDGFVPRDVARQTTQSHHQRSPDMTTSYKTTGEVHTITHALRHHEPTQDYCPFNTLRPRQMDAISQTPFSNAFSWIKMFEIRLKFYWVYFLWFQLTIFQHWFRYWLGDKPLPQSMIVSLLTHICVTRPQWVNLSLWYMGEILNAILLK